MRQQIIIIIIIIIVVVAIKLLLVPVVLTLVQAKQILNKHKRKNTKAQYKQNTVNKSTHIAKTPKVLDTI